MNIKNISVKDLIPYEKNTKKHDDVQINNVAESIKQYGFVQPIVIDKNNVVVIGHCRLLAAKKLTRIFGNCPTEKEKLLNLLESEDL